LERQRREMEKQNGLLKKEVSLPRKKKRSTKHTK